MERSTESNYPWHWQPGNVDRSNEHMELLYGDFNTQDPKDFISAALISPPHDHIFNVQFLIDEKDEKCKVILKAVRHSLDFYIVELRKIDPWEYAKYHCTTASNLYSNVHWLYFPDGLKGGQ